MALNENKSATTLLWLRHASVERVIESVSPRSHPSSLFALPPLIPSVLSMENAGVSSLPGYADGREVIGPRPVLPGGATRYSPLLSAKHEFVHPRECPSRDLLRMRRGSATPEVRARNARYDPYLRSCPPQIITLCPLSTNWYIRVSILVHDLLRMRRRSATPESAQAAPVTIYICDPPGLRR